MFQSFNVDKSSSNFRCRDLIFVIFYASSSWGVTKLKTLTNYWLMERRKRQKISLATKVSLRENQPRKWAPNKSYWQLKVLVKTDLNTIIRAFAEELNVILKQRNAGRQWQTEGNRGVGFITKCSWFIATVYCCKANNMESLGSNW